MKKINIDKEIKKDAVKTQFSDGSKYMGQVRKIDFIIKNFQVYFL